MYRGSDPRLLLVEGLEDAGATAGFAVFVVGVDHVGDPAVEEFDSFGVAYALGDGRHFALRVVGVFHAAGDDGLVRAAGHHHVLSAAGAAAGGGGLLADAIAGVDLAVVVQVVAGVGGRALVVVTMLAVYFQVGPQAGFHVGIGAGGGTAVARYAPVRQALDVGGDAAAIYLQGRHVGQDALILPVLELVHLRKTALPFGAHEAGFRNVGTVQVAGFRADGRGARFKVVIGMAGDALVLVGNGVAVGGAGQQLACVLVFIVPAYAAGFAARHQFGHFLAAVVSGPAVGGAAPDCLATLGGALDQQAGFHQLFGAFAFVNEGEGFGDHGAIREVNGAVQVAAVLAIHIHRLGAGWDERNPVLGGIVSKQLGVEHERHAAFMGHAAWVLRVGEQVVLVQARAVDNQGFTVYFTRFHRRFTQLVDVFLGGCQVY